MEAQPMTPMLGELPAMDDDLTTLGELNDDYLESVKMGDVERFREILADDFLCSSADGSVLDKAQFLELTAGPRSLRYLGATDIRIRLFGDVAIIHAATTFTTMEGREGRGRYTDVWAKRDGVWRAVAAHVTRL
jgi:ketosteroid isomerase-like protein